MDLETAWTVTPSSLAAAEKVPSRAARQKNLSCLTFMRPHVPARRYVPAKSAAAAMPGVAAAGEGPSGLGHTETIADVPSRIPGAGEAKGRYWASTPFMAREA